MQGLPTQCPPLTRQVLVIQGEKKFARSSSGFRLLINGATGGSYFTHGSRVIKSMVLSFVS